MLHTPIIAFDFSMNKPAMASFIDNKLELYIFPSNIDSKSESVLTNAGVTVVSRNLEKMHNKGLNEHELILKHVTRASNLADLIIKHIKVILEKYNVTDYSSVIIANEGFAFSSNGNATLDLSGYKYILMYKLMLEGFNKFKTYAPVAIKSTAGCAKRGMGKNDMIEQMGNENQDLHLMIYLLAHNPQAMKKKANYVTGTDDLADAFWCLKTVVKKENINCTLAK
jgi:hypothetical protein